MNQQNQPPQNIIVPWKRVAIKTASGIGICALIAVLITYGFAITANKDEDTSSKLTWPAPKLENAQIISVTKEKTQLRLDNNKDYVLILPCSELVTSNGLTVVGGRNVIMVGGTIRVQNPQLDRGLYLADQTGVVHIEGLHIAGDLNEGINLSQKKGAIVQLQDILIDTVKGSKDGHHADVIQTWAGPAELRVDRLVGSTNYQGLFLLPNQHFKGAQPVVFDLRNIELTSFSDTGYLLWRDKNQWPIKTENVKLKLANDDRSVDTLVWPKPSANPEAWKGTQLFGANAASESIQITLKQPAPCTTNKS